MNRFLGSVLSAIVCVSCDWCDTVILHNGGGAGLGVLIGTTVGGKGAGIGAAAGGGGGLLTQVFTRGTDVKIPAEAALTFRLDRTLVLRPN